MILYPILNIADDDDGDQAREYLNNSTEFTNVKNYEATADGVTDDFQAIQDAVDNNDIVVIGGKDETFLISQPIYLNSGNRVIINGTVKLQDAEIEDLTADVTAGVNVVSVANADQYFAAGQWVCVSDDDRPLAGGGIGGNRDNRIGDGVRIASVTSTTVTFETNLIYSYTTAANAKIGHLQSCFIEESISDVVISGNGTIDANRANQYNVEPIDSDGTEEFLAGCCIVSKGSSSIIIEDVDLKDGGLHNLTLRTVTNFRISNIDTINAHDKSILLFTATKGLIENVYAKDSVYEDGVILYAQNEEVILNNIRCEDNPRYGININASNKYITATNCQAGGNGIDLATGISTWITITNMNLFGDGTNHIQIIGSQYVVFNNLTIDCLDGLSNMSISGASSDICVNGGFIAESQTANPGITMGLSGGNYPTRVFVDNFMFRNCDIAQNVDMNCTDIYFSDCKFFGNTSNGTTNTGVDTPAVFTDCIGI